MKIINNPPQSMWDQLSKRPQLDLEFLDSTVRNILTRVKKSGDNALREFTKQYDHITLQNIKVTEEEIELAAQQISSELKAAIQQASENIRKFHDAQRISQQIIETMPGVRCWRQPVPINSIGIYIPGGSAPLFSTVLMLAIPAQLAGCNQIVLCTPPNSSRVHPAIVYAARQSGVTNIFTVGGAQAIAAMAYGTESIPKVYKIFGPGNQFVTKAKQLVTEDGVAIDMPAGPSEVLVIADESADPEFVAADLLSQAEHNEDSQVVLVTTKPSVIDQVTNAINNQLSTLPRKSIIEKALQNSLAICFDDISVAIDFINSYAPEHLIITTHQPGTIANQIMNAGSVFLGNYTPEAVGDYASGTNHTLPTNGYARVSSGVSLESFMKYITFQELTPQGLLTVSSTVMAMAEAEQLEAHKRAVALRLKKLYSV